MNLANDSVLSMCIRYIQNTEVEDQAKWLAGEQWSRKCALIYMQRLVITRAISRQPVPRRRLI